MSGNEVEVWESPAPMNIFGAEHAEDVVANATSVAKALSAVIESQKLYNTISGRKHVKVEGWTLLGSMLGVFPIIEWTRRIPDEEGGGWEARVIVRTKTGDIVGSAEAMVSREEKTWQKREDYALRSMAQTRAVSKAMRHPLGFVMTLAGFDPTPEAEMSSGPQTPAAPAGPELSEATLQKLLTILPVCEGYDAERWTLDAVLATATRVFGRPIERLGDLTEPEAARILNGAETFVQATESLIAAQADRTPEEDVPFGEAEEH